MSTPASGHGSMRAADTDRIQVAQLLTDAAASGTIGLTEYEDRLTRAYAAQTNDELDRLSADLPGAVTRGRSGPCRPAPSTLLLAILSGYERRGRWNVPRRLTTFALLGWRRGRPALRRLHLPRGRDPLLLDHGRADDRGATRGQCGSAGRRGNGKLRPDRRRRRLPGAPLVRISGFSLWGSVAVKRKKRKAPRPI